MTALKWDTAGKRFFQAGVDRGVLYIPGGSAVAWSGLTSIDEAVDDESAPYYLDGRKYMDRATSGDFSATLKALTYPSEFERCIGTDEIDNGLFAGDQKPQMFNLCYRTRVGNDLEGADLGYQIHILYNCIAVPDARTFSTLGEDVTPTEFSWGIETLPEAAAGYRPTAHIVIDSTELYAPALVSLEALLYGTDDDAPDLPSLSELLVLMIEWTMIVITDHGDGSWSATGPDELITLLDPTTIQITDVDATYLDADTYEVSTTYLS